ncbi:hypothetical protein AMAG_07209 [Allomyces macrogynus ATCC 38327]|uniref:Threonine/serine exporter-like N-terminal domain-containing protein n=1 Tax=Allomyces macrogynus (strain ATCC 38327) TaxID=578462 RepID=A0A0L0SHK5_ALLM3|nr:hypothetical protein AMAG_07209 [Allomyces macrogynus ATCC 38327]|eukprot:KNE61942.1 hypothetical protein AMAG_07209 [Allomyces macrogynus ATCC 38327]
MPASNEDPPISLGVMAATTSRATGASPSPSSNGTNGTTTSRPISASNNGTDTPASDAAPGAGLSVGDLHLPGDPHAAVLKAQKLLLRLTKALFLFGAPLYRVEIRVQDVADMIGIPVSILSLPNAVILAFGDGTSSIWPQTYIVKGFQENHMGKLQDVDRWARKLAGAADADIESRVRSKLREKKAAGVVPEKPAKSVATKRGGDRGGDSEQVQGLLHETAWEDAQDSSAVDAGARKQNAGANGAPSNPTASNLRLHPVLNIDTHATGMTNVLTAESGQGVEIVQVDKSLVQGMHVASIECIQTARMQSAHPTLSLTEAELDVYLEELDLVVNAPPAIAPWLRIVCIGFGAMFLAMLWYPTTPYDMLTTLFLGTLNGFLTFHGERLKLNALEVLVPLVLGFVGKAIELMAGSENLCFGTVTVMSTFNFYPGIAVVMAMVELASRNLVSGTVRMFYSFIRALKLGFGLALGSRLSTWLSDPLHNPLAHGDIKCMETARPGAFVFKSNPLLLMTVFFPLAFCINVFLRANPRQWGWMVLSSAIGLFTLLLSTSVFEKDTAAAQAAFTIGLTSHLYARKFNDIAMASLLAGIFWLVPGAMGVKGAASLMSEDLKGSTTFAIEMIVRALSLSIGLYVSSLLLPPMTKRTKVTILSL